jgi:hypothetical protein
MALLSAWQTLNRNKFLNFHSKCKEKSEQIFSKLSWKFVGGRRRILKKRRKNDVWYSMKCAVKWLRILLFGGVFGRFLSLKKFQEKFFEGI